MLLRKHAVVARTDLLPQTSAEKFSLTLRKESSRSDAVTCFVDGGRRAVDIGSWTLVKSLTWLGETRWVHFSLCEKLAGWLGPENGGEWS